MPSRLARAAIALRARWRCACGRTPRSRQRVPLSTGVWSADGELLRVTRAADDQYRLWVPLAEISPTLVEAFLLKEDRWFYWHAGVNPIALARAGVPHVSRRRASGRLDDDDAARADDLPPEYQDTGRQAPPGRRCASGSRRGIRNASCSRRI